MNQFLVLDCETSPMPEGDLIGLMPDFEAARHLRDPAKIQANIEEKRKEWMDEAALKADRGRILVIGSLTANSVGFLEGEEKNILEHAWELIKHHSLSQDTIVGHNIVGFDLPFMVRRSWRSGVRVPEFVVQDLGQYRQPRWVFDTMLAWTFNNKHERIGLDAFAKHLGVGAKNGKGQNFAKLYAETPDKALEYLANDLRLCRDIYLRLHQFDNPRFDICQSKPLTATRN